MFHRYKEREVTCTRSYGKSISKQNQTSEFFTF